MKEPKISVIVPVYKVEPYLRKCLDSIVNQTYRNLEIILVDDGSPDNCGAICDEYAAGDGRIRVIHQENGGVSSARNAGLSAVTGEWVGWVDSDDWIEPDMYEYLLKNALAQNADIAVCSRAERYRAQTVFRAWECVTILEPEQALKALLENDMMQNYLWDKLWRRELFQNIRFPKGRTFEDIAVMDKLFLEAGRVVCLPGVKYHYVQRSDSIVADISLLNRWDHYTAARNRYDTMKDEWPQFRQLLEAQCVASAVGIWTSYYANPKEERRKYQEELKEVAAFGKAHYRDAFQYMNLGLAGRMVLHLIPYATWWAFGLAGLVGWGYKVKHGRAL